MQKIFEALMQPVLSSSLTLSETSRDFASGLAPLFLHRGKSSDIAKFNPQIAVSSPFSRQTHEILSPLQAPIFIAPRSFIRLLMTNTSLRPIWIVSHQVTTFSRSLQGQPTRSTKILPRQTAPVKFAGEARVQVESSDFVGSVIIGLSVFTIDPEQIETIDKASEHCIAALLFPLLVDDSAYGSIDAVDDNLAPRWQETLQF